jgi:hypothetical protein
VKAMVEALVVVLTVLLWVVKSVVASQSMELGPPDVCVIRLHFDLALLNVGA